MLDTIVFMFSGQGSQYYKMGTRLMDEDPIFNYWMRKLDVIASDLARESILRQIYGERNNGESFKRLLYTHPAIYMVEFALSQSLIEAGIRPRAVLGMSLGEYAAFTLAGSLNYENALMNIVAQARLIEQYCERGGMLAVLDSYIHHQEKIIQADCDLVAVNTDSHFVLSSSSDNLTQIEEYLDKREILYQRLPVEYAFHSKKMVPIEALLKDKMQDLEVDEPEVPIVSCVYGTRIDEPTSSYFWDVYRQPIRFREAFQYLKQLPRCKYIDLSPGSTLANYAKRNLSVDLGSLIYPIMTPYDSDAKNMLKVKKYFK
jgi:acyl transferase domain-containing protein